MENNDVSEELSPNARALRCVADGRVLPLAELSAHDNILRRVGDGYAVVAGGGIISEYFTPEREISVCAPADGVVTAAKEILTLRTGDGISVSVIVGSIAVPFLPSVGDKLRIGDVLCSIPKDELSLNGISGAIAVVFNDVRQITELHVDSGRKKAGERAAFYKVTGDFPAQRG